MTESIIIRNFGPLKEIEIQDLRPFVFLIGPSGSGKSTLLKVVAMMRWIYKMICIRSYLNYSGIKVSTFSIDFKRQMKLLGLDSFIHGDTYIEYHYGTFSVVYDKKLKMVKKRIDQNELSLEKLSFISDKRGIIGDLLEHNLSLKKRSFYANETFEDYMTATEAIRTFDIPGLGVRLNVKKNSNGEKHLIEPQDGDNYSILLKDASSGTQSSIPLSLIVEYYTKQFDIVASLNDSVFSYVSKSDSLKDFRAVTNVGELPNKRVSLFIEEPEISLYPMTQKTLMDSIISSCNSVADYQMNLMVATHSPYIINHLNVMLRRGRENGGVDAPDLGVYLVQQGRLCDLIAEDLDTGEKVVDATELSEPMEDIFRHSLKLPCL